MLLSTHILPEVEAVCDRVLIIDRGRIVAEGTPADLRAKLAGAPVVHVDDPGERAGAGGARWVWPAWPRSTSSETPEETRVRVAVPAGQRPARGDLPARPSRQGWVLRELSREAMTLEDVFVRLTRQDEAPAAPADAPERGAAAPEVPS